MTTLADIPDAQLVGLAISVLAAPGCTHPRCDGELHFSTVRDPETGAYDEEGPCPDEVAS